MMLEEEEEEEGAKRTVACGMTKRIRSRVLWVCLWSIVSVGVLIGLLLQWSGPDIVPERLVHPKLRALEREEHALWRRYEAERRAYQVETIEEHSGHPLLHMAVDECENGGCINGDVLVLHQGRCGSTALLRAIANDMERIIVPPRPEVLAEDATAADGTQCTWRDVERSAESSHLEPQRLVHYIEQLKGRTEAQRPAAAVRIITSVKMEHIDALCLSVHQFLQVAAAAGYRHLVVIHRSYLRVQFSGAVVRAHGVPWHSPVGTGGQCLPVSLPPTPEYYEHLDVQYRDALFSPYFKNFLPLSYEQDIQADLNIALRKLSVFFDVSMTTHESQFDKTVADCPLGVVLENFDEHEAALSGTKWEYLLERDIPNAGQDRRTGTADVPLELEALVELLAKVRV